jgi:hypothetical protein
MSKLLFPAPKPPKKEDPALMPDELELRRKARKDQARLAARYGRASTILDDEGAL